MYFIKRHVKRLDNLSSNNFYDRLRFTLEKENNCDINFLDMTLYKQTNDSFYTS